ncbi:ankyrin repeat domain-containing protein [Legionella sp. D16C41]|uniref:ankyrin repeat domain-containing protein n=1 Tax=Legionella sp. D16C41 TaxID=3402688 RepID=UPI003AF7AA3F
MSAHEEVVNLYNALGYGSEDGLGYGNEDGLCNGFSLRWLEASLLGKEEQQRFENRIKLIASMTTEYLVDAINKTKAKKGENLTDKDYELIDIIRFYDSLTLFQLPGDWAFLFNRSFLNQENIEVLSTLASSEEIEKKGGLKPLYSEPLILSKEEIETYLIKLGQVFDTTANLSTEPIGILLGSENHTVALTYQPSQGWSFRDSNQIPYTSPKTKLMAAAIEAAFAEDEDEEEESDDYKKEDKSSDYSAFNTQVILTKNDPRCSILEEKLTKFKHTTQPITDDIALRKGSVNLLFIAAQYNHLEDVVALIKAGADFNQTDEDNITPIWTAAFNGYTKVVKELINAGAKCNELVGKKSPPICAAARGGHVETVDVLAKAKVDLNLANINNQTPLWIAAEKGHVEVVKKLIEYGVKLDEKDNSGNTPLGIAANNGHAEIVRILVEKGARLNEKENNGFSPLHLAANKGHLDVIKELIKAGADLTQVDAQGKTALWIAANNGHAEVIRELVQKNPNLLDCSNENSASPLLMAARNGHTNVVELLIELSHKYKDKVNLNQLFQGMTPILLAAQEGHFAIVKKLLEANADHTIPMRRTVAQLKYFALFKHDKNIEQQVKLFVKDLPDSAEVIITPYDIANLMGHNKIAELINEHKVQQTPNETNTPYLTGAKNLFFLPTKTVSDSSNLQPTLSNNPETSRDI